MIANFQKRFHEISNQLEHDKLRAITNMDSRNEDSKSFHQDIISTKFQKWHECRNCDEKFTAKNSLLTHIKNKHSKTYRCKNCDEVFMKRCQLEQHILYSHSNKKMFECNICEKSFAMEWRLAKHREMHQKKMLENAIFTITTRNVHMKR